MKSSVEIGNLEYFIWGSHPTIMMGNIFSIEKLMRCPTTGKKINIDLLLLIVQYL